MTKLPAVLRPWWPYGKRVYTLATRLVAPVLMRWARARGGYLPTHIAVGTDAALAGPDLGVAHLVAPADAVLRTVPDGIPPNLEAFAAQAAAHFAPQQVLDLPGARVLGPQRAVITAQGALLHDVVRYFGTTRGTEHPLFLHPKVGAPIRIPGRLAVMATRGDANYYHFLHDVVPRLSVLERCSDLAAPEWWYVPLSHGFQRQLIELLALPLDRIVDSDQVPHVTAERLLVPTVADLDLNHPAWSSQYLRKRLLPPGAGLVKGRRIYLTRGGTRHTRIVKNEADLMDMLRSLGFVVVDPGSMTVREQIRTFAEAEIIVAPHGAGLANLVFASPGASLIEIFAPDFVQGCYWKLSTTIPGVQYRYLVGQGRVLSHREAQGVASDIHIDVRSLKQMIDKVVLATSQERGGSA